MIRKIILVSVITSQLLVSCSKDDDSAPSNSSLDSEIAQLIQKPYSDLTPSQQKVKLENEANSALDQMDNLKSAGAIEALQTLEYVMNIGNSIDIMNGKNDNHVTDLLNISGAYGTYTWDNTHHVWVKTASTSNLKFVFPSKKSQLGVNNAVLTSTAVSSNVKVDVADTEEEGTWDYNYNTGEMEYHMTSPAILDNLYLPSSVAATLTIDNVQAATLTAENAYPSGENIPSSASYKVALNDGYVWEQKGTKGQLNSFSSSLSYKGSNIISFSSGATADIDKAIADNLPSDFGKVNYMVEIMDNLAQVANIDVENLSKDEDDLDDEPDYDSPNYYTALNAYNKSNSEAAALAFNTNVKMALVSQKDGTKIADVIMKSEKGDSYTDYYVWNSDYEYWEWDENSSGHLVQDYIEVQYLRFNDNTLVSMEVYFSSGFTVLQTNFDDFLSRFND